MRTIGHIAAVGLLALSLSGCEEGSARKAVEGAEAAIAAVQEQGANIAPARLQSLQDSMAAIKTRLEAGEHRSALMSARSVTSLARDLGATMGNTKTQLENAFKNASDELPPMLQKVTARINEVAAMRRLPSNIDAAKFATVQSASAGWTDLWNRAMQDYQSGKLAAAMGKANELRTALRSAMNTLSMDA
jgi:hypothetical protein